MFDATLSTLLATSLAGTYTVKSFEGDYSLDHELSVCHLQTIVEPPISVTIDLEENPTTVTILHG